MRITFVQPRLDLSGGARVIALYSQALATMGHRVCVVAARPAPERFSATVKRWLRGEFQGGPPSGSEQHRGAGVDIRILESHRPITDADVPDADVVIATWWETAEWVAGFRPCKGAKVYFIQHHEVFDYLPVARAQATYRMPMHKIVIARWLQDVMATEYGDPTVDLVPNSVDRSQFFAPARSRQANPTVGFLYSAAPFKGLDITLGAVDLVLNRMPDLRVITFGLRDPSRQLPLPRGAEFHRSPPQDRIRELYSRCDAWITASRSEGFNLPALEAMACRTPIVATRAGWPAEAVKTGSNGVLVDVDDVAGVASGAEWILSRSPEEWRALSDGAYATSQRGSWEKSAVAFEAALKNACRRAARGEIAGECRGCDEAAFGATGATLS
jgi:glycosyltransferase involved in cell wall biosynthesis